MPESQVQPSKEIFSFHLLDLPFTKLPKFLFGSSSVSGLNHGESLFTMNLGEEIMTPHRYNPHAVAYFAWWNDEASLDAFLERPEQQHFNDGWHVRMRLYRRWGQIRELQSAHIDADLARPDQPVVAVTLARLKLTETTRFIKWGRPVEAQVRDHKGQRLALAAMRPLNTFSTFSIWNNEAEMLNMVNGNGREHSSAMRERVRKDFHHEFTTMRFVPFKEVGSWKGRSGYVG